MSQLVDAYATGKSKFAAFTRDAKIHPTRILIVSHELEALRPEDRAIKLAKRRAAGKDDDASKAVRSKKPRSGRPVTERLLHAALTGGSLSGPAKTRLLRAVNALQVQRKQAEADLRKLF